MCRRHPAETERQAVRFNLGQRTYFGWREDLRSRFRRGGFADLRQKDQLELLLMLAIPHGDIEPQTLALIARFGSLRRTLDAPLDELQRIPGISRAAATNMRIIRESATLYLKQRSEERSVLSSPDLLEQFWRSRLGGADREVFEVAHLDSRLRLLRDGVQSLQHGTVESTIVYPRMVVEAALKRGSSAIVLAHNHPTGDPTPSRVDIDLTRAISLAAATVQIRLVDHLVIGSDAVFSMRAADYL